MSEKRICSTCGLPVPIINFDTVFSYGKWKYRSSCIPCENKRKSRYSKGHGREKRKIRRSFADRKYKLGVSKAQFETMLHEQDYKCKICEKENELVVDHDHETQEVRGLLCANCNLLLGYAFDNPSILRKAANYIEETT